MNKDTLKERSWKIKFTKKFSDNIVPGSVANDFIYLHKDCGKELMGFIETLIEQTRKEEKERILEMIKPVLDKAEQSYKTAVSDQVAPYRHQFETLLDIINKIKSNE